MTDQKTRQANLNKASAQASATLKAKYTDEWNELMGHYASALGEEWAPRLSEEERAAKEIQDLLAKYPTLAQRVGMASTTTQYSSGSTLT